MSLYTQNGIDVSIVVVDVAVITTIIIIRINVKKLNSLKVGVRTTW